MATIGFIFVQDSCFLWNCILQCAETQLQLYSLHSVLALLMRWWVRQRKWWQQLSVSTKMIQNALIEILGKLFCLFTSAQWPPDFYPSTVTQMLINVSLLLFKYPVNTKKDNYDGGWHCCYYFWCNWFCLFAKITTLLADIALHQMPTLDLACGRPLNITNLGFTGSPASDQQVCSLAN